MGDYGSARPLLERALSIREQTLGPSHPSTAHSLNNLAALLYATGDYVGARPLLERALAINEATLGPDHSDTILSLNNLAGIIYAMGDHVGVRPLLERALAINEKTLGPDHSGTALSLHNLARLLYAMGDYDGARPLLEQALAISEAALEPDHPTIMTIRTNLATVVGNVPENTYSETSHDLVFEPVLLDLSSLVQRTVMVLHGTPDEQAALLAQLVVSIDQTKDTMAQLFIWTIAQTLQGISIDILGHGLKGMYARMWSDFVISLREREGG
jgi:tetratricopeptide (TPR) repeat protein